MVERKVRYNKIMNTDTPTAPLLSCRWTFAIINQPREIERIEQRIFNQLSPCDELITNFYRQIKNSGGLYVKIISFSSEKERIFNYHKIYSQPKKFKKDRDLRDAPEEKLETYVQRLIS